MTNHNLIPCPACHGGGLLKRGMCRKCEGCGRLEILKPDLLALTPTSWREVPARGGAGDWLMLYYGVSEAGARSAPIGTRFAVVYSPSPFSARGWCVCCFDVVMSLVRGEWERMYREAAQFELETEEVVYCEALWMTLRQSTAAA